MRICAPNHQPDATGEEMRRDYERHKHPKNRRKGKKESLLYSAEQQATLRRGLRILARLIARAYLRQQSQETQV